jgi:hypothetical protein
MKESIRDMRSIYLVRVDSITKQGIVGDSNSQNVQSIDDKSKLMGGIRTDEVRRKGYKGYHAEVKEVQKNHDAVDILGDETVESVM